MPNHLRRHHLPHVGSPGRISDHGSPASDQGDRFIAALLQAFHQAERHEVSHMEAVRRRVKADIEHGLSVIYHLSDLIFIGYLRDQPAGNQFIVKLHLFILLLFSVSG